MFDSLRKLWNDDAGAIIASEYLMLGSIVVVGGAAGMNSMRDSVAEEMKEYGTSLRQVRQAYVPADLRRQASLQTPAPAAVDFAPLAMP